MAESLAIDRSQLLVGVALTGSRKSKNVVKWAAEKFLPEGNVIFKLIHVYPKITIVPTPMGTWLPASHVGKDVLNGYRKQVKLNKQRKLIPHQKKLNAQKIKAGIVLLESDDIPMALSMEIARQSIRHLVIGITSASIFSMKTLSLIKGSDISQDILENAPSLCSVYVIDSDAKLKQLRPADLESGATTMDDTSNLTCTSTNTSSSSSSPCCRLSKTKSTPSSPRYENSATASGSSHSSIQPGPIRLSKETVELEHYAFKNTYFDSCNVSVRSHSSSSEDSESWISYQFSPESSFVAARSNASSVTGTPPSRSFVSTPATSSCVGTPPTVSYAGTPPTGSFMATPPAVSPVGTPPVGSYASIPPTVSHAGTPNAGTPPAVSRTGTRTRGSYVGTPPKISPAGTPIGGSCVGTSPSVSCTRPPTGGSYVGAPPATFRAGTSTGGSYVGTPPTANSSLGIPSDSKTGRTSQGQITEFEKLRIEMKHIEKMYQLSQNGSIDERFLFPLDELNEISKQRLEEASKLKEEKFKELSRKKNKSTAAKSEVTETGENFEKNQSKKKADAKLAEEAASEIKNKLEGLFASPAVQFQKFTWEEIMEATSSLSDEFKIGMGSFGTVYKCKLHHTTVAIKVLHSKNSVLNKQFVQELAILSTIRHPHLLMLLGAVPEESCLVYEYMDYGNLDDRLFRKNGKPPLAWYDRFRICYEVAGALAFLHNTTPRPIIHRDLKPANILLDHNLVSKIGDAGLGTMINVEPTDHEVSLETIYKETSPVGTLSYIDPEYQRTGKVSTKSDTYALGVVLLQLLTKKSAAGISYVVEDAINEGTFTEMLDPEAGEWPEKETLELALLGLECAQLRGRDRPTLRDKVLPILERLNLVADSARELASIPPHYFCPILKDMMEDPYVAADGYTYERSAIEQWLIENDTSPTTNQPLPHKSIIPNTTLLKAIKQWKSNNLPKQDT